MTRPIALLACGAVAGGIAAAIGLLAAPPDADELPDGAVAAVNGSPVRRADWERAVEALASDRRDALDEADKRHVLDRLVDEELLVQRAFELGLARRDRRVRADLVAAVIESVTSEAALREPSDAELRAFFAEHRDYFTSPGRQQAEQVFVRADDGVDAGASSRAREAATRLRAGSAASDVQASAGEAPVAALPATPLPANKLREYLGPAAVEALAALAPGDVSEPLRAAGGWQVLRLVAREPATAPEFAEVEAEVRQELLRSGGDEALRRYLDELRRRATIRVAGAPP